ncbi:hypothetical protein SAMN05192580_3725 [Sphingomonas jatrophae]|uniref:Uncharacterized protein n=1 Tax=Sphingomonas jatrophae TaxID=1166337 RepID=A0A1I6M9F7_9SPHN|nr:hypothetical protein SAMN05192580_3725 [Sphingomonas jatrophae]
MGRGFAPRALMMEKAVSRLEARRMFVDLARLAASYSHSDQKGGFR